MKPIFVTQPYLPPLDEFVPYLEQIWQSKTLSNGGPMHRRLEQELCEHLGVEHISLFANGTLALVTALQALRISGEVITTPYSFVATAHSLLWNGLTPVFADIDPVTLNLDPARIEAAITPQTTAIVPVHCYGTPCDVDAIQRIADNYNLKVIYDAAHAFNAFYKGRQLLSYGDLSTCSFHATKLYHSIEGGGLWCRDAAVRERSRLMRNFGHDGPERFNGVGINAKLSEMHAAVGIVMLDHMDRILARRAEQWDRYAAGLAGRLQLLRIAEGTDHYNRSYFPAVFADEATLLRVDQALQAHGIFARRYFHPALNELPYVERRSDTPVCASISRRVLCLPLFHDLEPGTQDLTMETILANL